MGPSVGRLTGGGDVAVVSAVFAGSGPLGGVFFGDDGIDWHGLSLLTVVVDGDVYADEGGDEEC